MFHSESRRIWTAPVHALAGWALCRRNLIGLMGLVTIVATLTLAPAGPAAASSVCYWNSFGSSSNCDGRNPDALGSSCHGDARTVKSAVLVRSDGVADGPTVQLRYSPSCRTIWAKIVGGWGHLPGSDSGGCGVTVHRNSDGKEYGANIGAGGNSAFTNVVYDADVTAYAYASCDSGATIYRGATGSY